jgi:hypothetical protein
LILFIALIAPLLMPPSLATLVTPQTQTHTGRGIEQCPPPFLGSGYWTWRTGKEERLVDLIQIVNNLHAPFRPALAQPSSFILSVLTWARPKNNPRPTETLFL